jgi:hypothetical protein
VRLHTSWVLTVSLFLNSRILCHILNSLRRSMSLATAQEALSTLKGKVVP